MKQNYSFTKRVSAIAATSSLKSFLKSTFRIIPLLCMLALSGNAWGQSQTYTYDFKKANDFKSLTAKKDNNIPVVAQQNYSLASTEDATQKMTFTVGISTIKKQGNDRTVKYNSSYGLEFDRCGVCAFDLLCDATIVVKIRSKAGVFGEDPHFGTTYTDDTYQDFGSNSTTNLKQDVETTIECTAGHYKVCCPEATGGSWRLEYP